MAAAQYYAHPRNLFWRLVGDVLGWPTFAALTYGERLTALEKAGIGLWDTVASAERRGSLDAAIRAVELAPLAALAATLPNLRAVAFNGAKAAALGRRALGGTTLALIDLPSSSPANAATSYADKLRRWGALKDFLSPDLNLRQAIDIEQ